jgi:hypothetical protein
VMPSYNEIDGVPSHANRWLLNDVLRAGVGLPGRCRQRLFRDPRDDDPPPHVRRISRTRRSRR